MNKPIKLIITTLVAMTIWCDTPLANAEEYFPLFVEGQPMAEIVIKDADANPDFSPWLLGAELHIPGNSSVGLGRPWVGDEIRSPEVHGWTRAGIPNTVEDVNDIFEQMTGTRLPVVSARTEGASAIVFEIVPADMRTDDEFRISFPDPQTMRIRGSGRSIRWAFNHILEHYAGVRWLFFDAYHYPEISDLLVPMQTIEERPSFPLLRDQGYYRPEMHQIRLGQNAKTLPFPRMQFHAMFRDAFPVEKYAPDQSWPEEILPIHGGQRITLPPVDPDIDRIHRQADWHSGLHPCFSNPATAEIAIENILEIMEADPDRRVIGLTVADHRGHCRGDDCLAVVNGRTNAMGFDCYSDLYYAWANAVAEGVSEHYPEVHFYTMAYREVFDAPGFDLHPNIISRISIDVHQTMDEEVGAEKWRQIGNWSGRASFLLLNDYGWGITAYALPRIYYRLHADFLKRFHEHGGAAARFAGDSVRPGFEGEGPKSYLFSKLLWDIDLDPNEVIDDWIVHTVGESSAPYLREYYDFWEDYWTGDDIRRTLWYQNSVDGGYFRWREWTRNRPISHTFVLQEGDMARLRELKQQVIDNAQTGEQRERAERLMLVFEYYEANAQALLSEYITPEGEIADAQTAVTFINAIPAAYAARDRREELLEPLFERPSPYVLEFDPIRSMLASFQGVAAFAESSEVREAIEDLLQNADLSDEQRAEVRQAWELGLAIDDPIAAKFAYRSTDDLELDGLLDDEFWKGLPTYELVDAITGEPTEVRTEFQVAWAEDGLYFAIRAEEPSADGPIVTVTEDQDPDIFQDDIIEIQIQTPTHSYYQIVLNAAGAIVDLDRSEGVNYDWTAQAQAAAHIGDGYWTLEVRIPVDTVEEFDPHPLRDVIGAHPTEDDPWHFNVNRMHRSGDDTAMAFAPLGQPGFHHPERFGRLLPAEKTPFKRGQTKPEDL